MAILRRGGGSDPIPALTGDSRLAARNRNVPEAELELEFSDSISF
jgi:hypothetical protein